MKRCKYYSNGISHGALGELQKEGCSNWSKASRFNYCVHFRPEYDGHCDWVELKKKEKDLKWPEKKKGKRT